MLLYNIDLTKAPPRWGFFILTLIMHTATYIEKDLIDSVRALGARVGRTLVHHITRLPLKPGVSIYAKKEWAQLSGSVKARAAYYIFRSAIEQGQLTRDKILLDATSGNTGIAYATIGKLLNIKVSLCLPENASQERKDILIRSEQRSFTLPNLKAPTARRKKRSNWRPATRRNISMRTSTKMKTIGRHIISPPHQRSSTNFQVSRIL